MECNKNASDGYLALESLCAEIGEAEGASGLKDARQWVARFCKVPGPYYRASERLSRGVRALAHGKVRGEEVGKKKTKPKHVFSGSRPVSL